MLFIGEDENITILLYFFHKKYKDNAENLITYGNLCLLSQRYNFK